MRLIALSVRALATKLTVTPPTTTPTIEPTPGIIAVPMRKPIAPPIEEPAIAPTLLIALDTERFLNSY